ncbi:MAG: TatD family hydrolase [bacterium]|nr:TatD family hydrolase [bacterium]
MLVDTHGHVSFQAFKDDADVVLKRALQNNTWVIMPGTQFSTSQKAVEMAGHYPEGVYVAIGLHPIHLAEKRRVDVLEVQSENVQKQDWMVFETKAEEFDYEKYKTLGQSKKVVAIGEFGLDYYYEPKSKAQREAQRMQQKTTLALQLKLAEELQLPIILHCRKAHEDLLEILQARKQKMRGVVHCYTGDLKQAEQFYNLGLYFGFNGLIFKDVPALPNPEEIISSIPLDRIVLETDSPYLVPPLARHSPDGKRDEGGPPVERNEPLFVRYIAEEIARIKKISVEEVAKVTTQNAKTLFGLK